MLKSINTNLNIRNADGEIGQEPKDKSLSVALATEQEQLITNINNRLDMSISELANALEEITVNISTLIGLKNINNLQINPATEDTLVEINNKLIEINNLLNTKLSTLSTEATLILIKTNLDIIKTTIESLNTRDFATQTTLELINSNINNISTKLDTQLSSLLSNTNFNTKIGEIQSVPTQYTVLGRLKDIWDRLATTLSVYIQNTVLSVTQSGTWIIQSIANTVNVVIQTGSNVIGFIKKRPDYTNYNIYNYTTPLLNIDASITQDLIIPNGVIWHLNYFSFSRHYTVNKRKRPSICTLIWDPNTENKTLQILSSDGTTVGTPLNYKLIGDGTKVLRIIVTNASEDSAVHNVNLNYYIE